MSFAINLLCVLHLLWYYITAVLLFMGHNIIMNIIGHNNTNRNLFIYNKNNQIRLNIS